MNKMEKELNEIFNGQGKKDLTTFLKRKVNSKFFRKKNEKEILRLLPSIISHTNSNNCGWLEIFRLYSIDGVIDILIDNLDQFKFNHSEVMMMKLFGQLQLNDLTEDNIKKLLDKVNQLDCTITESTLELICYHLKSCNIQVLKDSFNSFFQKETICVAALDVAPFYLEESIVQDLIHKNSEFLINHVENLYWLKEKMAFDGILLEKVNDKINQDAGKNIINLVKDNCNRFYYSKDLCAHHHNYNIVVEIIEFIIEDLCKNEEISPSEIEWLGKGSFSTVLGIGSKVLKIGSERGTKTFPNNPYMNATLLRKEFKISEEISFFIEVNERVNTETKIENEELYQLYKKVRDIGLIWTDVAPRNVGRLLKDNHISWRQELPITDERLELKKYRGGKSLQEGDFVILDNDHIYDENDDPKEINLYATNLQRIFEERYQRELLKTEKEESYKKK